MTPREWLDKHKPVVTQAPARFDPLVIAGLEEPRPAPKSPLDRQLIFVVSLNDFCCRWSVGYYHAIKWGLNHKNVFIQRDAKAVEKVSRTKRLVLLEEEAINKLFDAYLNAKNSVVVEDVILSLAMDFRGVAENSFEEWAPEYGYDPDSRKAEKIYNYIHRQRQEFRKAFGWKALDDLELIEEE